MFFIWTTTEAEAKAEAEFIGKGCGCLIFIIGCMLILGAVEFIFQKLFD